MPDVTSPEPVDGFLKFNPQGTKVFFVTLKTLGGVILTPC